MSIGWLKPPSLGTGNERGMREAAAFAPKRRTARRFSRCCRSDTVGRLPDELVDRQQFGLYKEDSEWRLKQQLPHWPEARTLQS